MNRLRRTGIALHLFVGIGAMAGGFACLTNPYAPLGAPLALLEHSPFTSYFLPGLFLFGVLGIGNLFAAFCLYKFEIFGLVVSLLWGLILTFWIVIQCIMIQSIAALHVIFFCYGLVQTSLALARLIQSGDARYLLSEL
ncbi:MAG: hypothetical protein AB7C91_10575 [Sphaerochaeta sp.]|uniref:hypothetical protein n=1 Tax=Sphaerochaeta sp. TaxID=1972642 RepID=UPI002FC8F6B1